MKIAELLKIKSAAKAYLGLLAVAAQVALDHLPDHSGYYTAVQVLVGGLSLIGIYAVPNRVKTVEQGLGEAKKFASTLVMDVASADPQKVADAIATVTAPTAPVPPVEPAPVIDTPAPVTDPAVTAPAPAATPIQKDTPAP